MLGIDTERPLRTAGELSQLVAAVLASGPHDEADWVEWKTDVDLGSHTGQGTVARHILGMANRAPATAKRFVGGCGYLLLGVEPGRGPGITTVDPADLEPRIQQFLSKDDGPIWQPNWVQRGGTDFLVVIIDPPSQGNPIHTLQKQFGKYQEGEVFVRRLGRTEKARPADVRELTSRAISQVNAQLVIDLSASGGGAPRIVGLDVGDGEIESWLREEEEALLEPLGAELGRADRADDTIHSMHVISGGVSPTLDRLMRQQSEMANRMTGKVKKSEDRTPDEYRDQIQAYLAKAQDVAAEVARARHIESGLASISADVINPTDRPFREVEVTLSVVGESIAGFDGTPFVEGLPRRPRAWGSRWTDTFGGLADQILRPHAPFHDISRIDPGPNLHIDNSGSTRITFPPVSLGPQDRKPLPPYDLVVPGQYAGQVLVADWEARSIHVSGVVRGQLFIEVHGHAKTAYELLIDEASTEDT